MTHRSAPPSGHREYEPKSSRPLDLTVEEVEGLRDENGRSVGEMGGVAQWLVDGINALIESKRLANADRYSTGRIVAGVNGVPNRTDLVDPDDFSGGG